MVSGQIAFFGILYLARTLSPMWRSWSLGLRLALALAFLCAFDSWSFSRTARSGDLAMVGNVGSQSSYWGYSLRAFPWAVMRRYSDVVQKAVYHSSKVSFFDWTGRFHSRLPGSSGVWNVLCKYNKSDAILTANRVFRGKFSVVQSCLPHLFSAFMTL